MGDPGAVLLRAILARSGIISRMAARAVERRSQVDAIHDLASLIRTGVLLAAQAWHDHDNADVFGYIPFLQGVHHSALTIGAPWLTLDRGEHRPRNARPTIAARSRGGRGSPPLSCWACSSALTSSMVEKKRTFRRWSSMAWMQRAAGCVMGKSSGFSEGIESFAVLEHCPEHGDAASREGDQRLGVVFSFASFAVVEGLGERALRADCAEGALIEDAFERLVSAEGPAPACLFSRLVDVTNAGDELCREHHPHPRQRTDEGAIRVQGKKVGKVVIEAGDLRSGVKGLDGKLADQLGHGRLTGNGQRLGAGGGKGAFGQRFGAMKMRGPGQMRHDPPLSCLADFGRGDITGQEGERSPCR